MLSHKQTERLLAVSRYYYQDNLSQIEIAKKMNLSRPTVAKSLQLARDTGIVTVQINDPFTDGAKLQQALKEKYHLKDVVIAQQVNHDEAGIRDHLGAVAADYLDTIVTTGMTIGLNWGHTMLAVAQHLHASQAQDVQLVQLKGSLTNSAETNYSAEITQQFNHAFHTQARLLPLPLVFDDAQVKAAALHDPFIQRVVQTGYQADIALFTVGTTRNDALLFRSGYLTADQITTLQRDAVGDILSHYITASGEIADPQLDQRTVALPLSHLGTQKYAVLIAGGEPKLRAIHAALLGKYANVLIVDQAVAKQLLKL
ncbi:sugar-binding transcriptional regulator [Levilactobacillus acidifarinae]|uniref:Transcriptional regulator, DeoR family n=1 Tax=Levilactobacillus acidifarinae DSM 19394 = JCM 15949 TaxID=1423715 RepID=A0A0R1LKI9_9LACO|nr:sugar-binding transcriptional regulator [Levilactobacillus acidifarinae]KRK96088.1 transcriptional regulator, DeoR family [Levilactobacillus acidifarinae DSM 19394]GEO69638.1 DNA-binding transcriptional regulator [Levilactobacillus acidifarinae]